MQEVINTVAAQTTEGIVCISCHINKNRSIEWFGRWFIVEFDFQSLGVGSRIQLIIASVSEELGFFTQDNSLR